MTADWLTIFKATARAEGKTLREWLDECDRVAAAMSATVPDYLRHKPDRANREKPAA